MKVQKAPGDHTRRAADAALRCIAYGAMAKAFAYPKPGTRTDLLEMLESVQPDAAVLGESAAEACAAAIEALRRLRDAELEAEYLAIFTHVCSADCNPCETSYLCKHLFQVSQSLAELSGFYRAFGVEPNGERADHFSVELEFLSYLVYREAGEEMRGEEERAEESRQARRLFFERHIGRWFKTLLFLVRRKAGQGPYHAIAEFCEALLSSDAALLDAPAAERTHIGDLPLPVWEVDAPRARQRREQAR
ncbi:MAG: molecular chaperone TorD family protein [Armatimonadota bacterium]